MSYSYIYPVDGSPIRPPYNKKLSYTIKLPDTTVVLDESLIIKHENNFWLSSKIFERTDINEISEALSKGAVITEQYEIDHGYGLVFVGNSNSSYEPKNSILFFSQSDLDDQFDLLNEHSV